MPAQPRFQEVRFDPGKVQHIFTDSACIFSVHVDLALAAWAVTLANPGQIIATGHLTGMQQPVPVVELQAVLHAMQWVVTQGINTVMWCDALHVVEAFATVQREEFQHTDDSHDIWEQIQDQLALLQPEQIRINHVPSHVDKSQCEDGFEDWLAQSNNHADAVSVQTNLNKSWEFVEAHAHAVKGFQHKVALTRTLRRLCFAVAEEPVS